MPTHYFSEIPSDIAAINDYRHYAQQNLNAQTWAYIDGGGADEHTLKRNLSVYSNIKLLNRVLVDVSAGNTQLELLGQTLAHPIMIAPVAFHSLAHPDGELASAAAASAQQAVFTLSTYSSISIEQLASQVLGQHWFQLYYQQPREVNLDLIRRAENAGFKAIVFTVDAPINGLRNREQRAGFHFPKHLQAENLKKYDLHNPTFLSSGLTVGLCRSYLTLKHFTVVWINCGVKYDLHNPTVNPDDSKVFQGFMGQAPNWQDLAWLRQQTKLPFILKGVLHPLDAIKAKEHGMDALVISNHSGRSLDTLVNPIDVLSAIRQAVGELPLIVDSGIRRGTDIVKAYALGANAVMIGRPVLYALATAGALGVAHCLRLLRDELELSMALCGYASLDEIDADCLWQP